MNAIRSKFFPLLMLIQTLIAGPAMASNISTDAAESLLSSPEDSGWSLEEMMKAKHLQAKKEVVQNKTAEASGHGTANSEAKIVRPATPVNSPDALLVQLNSLKAKLKAEHSESEELRAALAQARLEKQEVQTRLQEAQTTAQQQHNDNKEIAELNSALQARSNELKQAAAALADLRGKQMQMNTPPIDTDNRRQAYIAGVMMSDGLSQRLKDWHDAGIDTDLPLFQSGLIDGLAQHIRLPNADAQKARNAFMQAVQGGANRQVVAAENKIKSLINGRKIIKSVAGITWLRKHKGRAVAAGQPVRLAMTEQVAGGKVISRVPPLILRPTDDVPQVVKEGMYLPGEGGEVVAYGLARAIYGDLPLPTGVQPWTVMEYHLTGSSPESAVQKR